MFQHLFQEQSIRTHFDAPGREAALAELTALLPSWYLNSQQKGKMLDLLLQRENLGTTALGDGIALPHCSLSDIPFPFASLGISRKGISYPSLDGEPVYLLALIVFPPAQEFSLQRHRILREAEIFFRDRFLKERLKICDSPQEAYEIILRESSHLSEIAKLAHKS